MENSKIVEWELTMKCNFSCDYCTNLDKSINDELSDEKLLEFQKMLNTRFKNTELFLFGGEPFLHPKINFIIENFRMLEQLFVFQTNFSTKTVQIINKYSLDVPINISIHPNEIQLSELMKNFNNYKTPQNIRKIDIMYVGKSSITYYLKIKKYFKNLEIPEISEIPIYLVPIGDFKTVGYEKTLSEFNNLKQSGYKNIINFEDADKLNPFNQKMEPRSKIWEDMFVRGYKTKGLQCPYKNKYYLYGPDLKEHHCCYRTEPLDNKCGQDHCFMM